MRAQEANGIRIEVSGRDKGDGRVRMEGCDAGDIRLEGLFGE